VDLPNWTILSISGNIGGREDNPGFIPPRRRGPDVVPNLNQGRTKIGWPEFTASLLTHFGPNHFYDPFGELTKLQHEGTVQEYQAKFESLLSKIGVLSQTRKVSCFISGLREVLKADVTAGKPEMLTSAISLARLYEARHSAITRSNRAEERKVDMGNQQTLNPPFLPIKRLMPKELKERQEKGLCFKCNDKYGPGHWCKKLFMIEACIGEDEDGDMEEVKTQFSCFSLEDKGND